MKQIIATMALLMAAMMTTTAAFGQTGTTIDVDNPASGTGYSVENGVITITSNGEYTLQGTTTTNRVAIAQGVSAIITLSNVSITSATASPLKLDSTGCNVTLRIVGANTLTSTVPDTEGEDRFSAAVQVEGSASVTIENSPISSSPTSGSLTATGSPGAAAIGSGYIERADGTSTTIAPGAITIKSGTIIANGGFVAAGIGGGFSASGSNITISGGTVTATGGEGGAAIGGGYYGATGNVTISGGAVTATGGRIAAGIGSGSEASGGSNAINISGGTVTATGGEGGAAIGSGSYTSGGNNAITISGGIIAATGGSRGAAIGSGYQGSIGNINITGGAILAICATGAAAIGSGFYDDQPASPGNIRIVGGSVFAYAPNGGLGEGAGIGPGVNKGANEGSINISGGNIMTTLIGATKQQPYEDEITHFTPTLVSDGIILTNAINTTSFGNATVLTGVTVTEAFVRATFENASKTGNGDTVIIEIPGETVHDTLMQIIHDTVTQIIHDTLVETQIIHDTIEISVPYEVVIVVDNETGAETTVQNILQTVSMGDDLYFIRGLDIANGAISIYDSQGTLIYRGTTNPVRIPGTGIFIVGQAGNWWKMVK